MAMPSHIGKFEVVSRLGEGGMGVVYLAKDPDLNRMVAIKVLSGYADEADAWLVRHQSLPFALSTSLNTSVAIRNDSRQAGMPQ